MTQKKFAEYFHMSRRNIEDWEKGVSECRPYLIELMQYKLEHEGIISIENSNKPIDTPRIP